VFLPRLANVFLAKQMKTCRCRPKHNFGWDRTRKPSWPMLQIFTATPNKKTSSTVKKYYRPAFVNKIAQCRMKNISGDYLRQMLAVFLSSQSLNNIWMMSIRKCSIGVTRWVFFRPLSVNFLGWRRLAFFSISIDESCVFAEVRKCFPCQGYENMPVSAETQLRLSSNKKT